jgi:hypothetical protein
VNAPPGAESRVLAWDEPSDEALNWTPPPGMTVEPLGKVYVTFYARYNKFSEKGFCISGATGHFRQHTTDWESTKDIRIDLTAEREGYATVNATFFNRSNYFLETKNNVLNIIMVPNGN